MPALRSEDSSSWPRSGTSSQIEDGRAFERPGRRTLDPGLLGLAPLSGGKTVKGPFRPSAA